MFDEPLPEQNTAIVIPADRVDLIPAGQAPQGRARRRSVYDIVDLWLETKHGHTGSERTKQIYSTTLASFRGYLENYTDCALDGDPHDIAEHAQRWAAYSVTGKELSTSTRNQRFAILSSFYQFAMKQDAYDENPIWFAERPARVIEHAAPHLDAAYVQERLAMIDTTTREGKRDKAILSLAVATGRRVSEIANLTYKDLTITGKRKMQVEVKFRCKGGKVMRDNLKQRTIQVLMDYLAAEYGPGLARITPDSPIFVSYSNRTRGKKLTIQALGKICEKRLGVSQFHTTRHTFAVTGKQAGMSLYEIGDRLGHSNYQITSNYMKSRESADNAYGDKLEELFGI